METKHFKNCSSFLQKKIFYLWFVSIGFSLIFYFFKLKANYREEEKLFWDFSVYYCSAKVWLAGLNPHLLENIAACQGGNSPKPFNYPPIAMYFLFPLGYLNYYFAKTLFIITSFGSLGSMAFLFKKYFSPQLTFLKTLLVILFPFGGLAAYSMFSGNLSILIYTLILIGLISLNQGKAMPFYIIILFTSLFKFHMILFLFIPLLMDLKNFKPVIISGLAFLFIYAIDYLAHPELFIDYLNTLKFLDQKNDRGDGFSVLLNFLIPGISLKMEVLAYIAFTLFIFTSSLWFVHRTKGLYFKSKFIRILWAMSLVFLVMPRIKIYDHYLFNLFLFFVFYIFYAQENFPRRLYYYLFLFLFFASGIPYIIDLFCLFSDQKTIYYYGLKTFPFGLKTFPFFFCFILYLFFIGLALKKKYS